MKFDGSVYWCVDKYVGDGVVRGIDAEVGIGDEEVFEKEVGDKVSYCFSVNSSEISKYHRYDGCNNYHCRCNLDIMKILVEN